MSGPTELPVFGEDPAQKSQAYRELDLALAALLLGEHDWIANLANTSALIYQALPQLNWAGFYLWQPAARAGAGGRPWHCATGRAGGAAGAGLNCLASAICANSFPSPKIPNLAFPVRTSFLPNREASREIQARR